MNESKPIVANMSSIVDLKAELYRKHESLQMKKLAENQRQIIEENDNNLYSINHLNHKKYKLGKRVREKTEQELRQKANKLITIDIKRRQLNEEYNKEEEEELALKKSKQMLEMKSQLYEKLSKNPNLINKDNNDFEDETDDRILVDFYRKASDCNQMTRNETLNKRETKEEEEWTEFTDSLGRTRRCLKKDLPHFLDIDKKSFQKSESNSSIKSDISSIVNLSANNELLSSDLRRELERRQWETNAKNELNSQESNDEEEDDQQRSSLHTHYQNVKFNEIRDHGVAYYAFSEDQQTRQQQMDLLNQMREQTVNQKLAKQNLKHKRKQLMRDRLAKVAQRKGISVDLKESSSDSDEDISNDVMSVIPEPRPVPTAVREWDVGKRDLHQVLTELTAKPKQNSYNNYIEDKRQERNQEFAPPINYDSRKQFTIESQTQHEDEDKRKIDYRLSGYD